MVYKVRHHSTRSDMGQDIAGPFPPTLLEAWAESAATEEEAATLLEPFRVSGTVACADGSGLTAMSERLDLIRLHAHLSRVKSLVHRLGLAAGGRAPGGAWIADNTQMFFPGPSTVALAVAAAVESHRQLPPDGMRMGFCLHHGDFYEINGGLYGKDADLVEMVAEEYSGPNETLLTEAARRALAPDDRWEFTLRAELAHLGEPIYTLGRHPRQDLPEFEAPAGKHYPYPYSSRFFHQLAFLDDSAVSQQVVDAMRNEYLTVRSVIVAEFSPGPTRTAKQILDTMQRRSQIAGLVAGLFPPSGELIENTGSGALASFETPREALNFALLIHYYLSQMGLDPAIGIDRENVLLLNCQDGSWRVAGPAVNVGSKLAHELGEPGVIRISDRAALDLPLPDPRHRFAQRVSGVDLAGWVLAPVTS